jgi:hypothetical protein
MAKPTPKHEKPEVTTEAFVKRLNKQGDKRNGLRRRMGHHHS